MIDDSLLKGGKPAGVFNFLPLITHVELDREDDPPGFNVYMPDLSEFTAEQLQAMAKGACNG